MPKDFIVAIELGSSKMTGVAGKKNLDGSIQLLAVVKEDSSSFIRKGYVNNIDKTAQCLVNIVSKLEKQLKTSVKCVYVGVGGQSIRSVHNVITKDLPADTVVTESMINDLLDANRNMEYPDLETIDVAVQEYRVDTQNQLDPVGIPCSHIEGNFLNILQRKTLNNNLNLCFTTAKITVADLFLAPLALADSVLTETEKRSGCALVDLGADTTTVSVYWKNVLRHLAVIPLGGNNITKDIASLQMEESDAEKMKLEYASAFTEISEIDSEKKYPIDADRQVDSSKFIEIVEGRVEEIVANVWCQIPEEYCDKLLGGIILTGGGSNMKHIEKAFANYTHIEKVRVAKFVNLTIIGNQPEITAKDARMNTVLGILAKGDMNCAGRDLAENDLFDNAAGRETPPDTGIPRPVRTGVAIPPGVVQTTEEKQLASDLARKKKEEADAAKRLEEEEKARKEAEERRKNSLANKMVSWLKKVGKEFTQEEE